jgi:hypothetical protein
MPDPVDLEPQAKAVVDANANPPYLFELGPDQGRRAVDAVQSGPVKKLIRMVPVAIALIGTHLRRATGLPPPERSQRHRLVRRSRPGGEAIRLPEHGGHDSMYVSRLTITLPTGR